jgi:hypothetical protein
MKLFLSIVAMFSLVACGPEPGDGTDGGGGSTGGGSTSGASTTDPTTGASTTDPSTGEAPPADVCGCDGPPCDTWQCDPVELGCEIDESCDPKLWWGINDEIYLDCTLEALRDRTPGRLRWSLTLGFDVPTAEEVSVTIRYDGTILRNVESAQACTRGPNTHSTLKDASYFAGCLAEPDARARFLCMREAVLADVAECAGESKIECPPPPSPD